MANLPWRAEIAGLLKANRITQRALALKMGVSDNWVSMILLGECDPKDAEARMKTAIAEIIAERQ